MVVDRTLTKVSAAPANVPAENAAQAHFADSLAL